MNERDLFLSALEIEDPEDRKAHLQAACADDADLLIRVESLLASHERESRFLQTPVVEQLGDDPTAATIVIGTGSTQDESPSGDSSAASILEFSQLQERVKMGDEIPLGYLEPSPKPGSLGRLAHYEILEVVGQGAFGTVLRAFDEKLQRVVAIKVMAPELAATSPARKRFVREAQASAAIRHENVVSVYNVEEKPIPYLVMEYIPGETLQHRLDERGPLDVPTTLRLGTQIAEGLAAAHAKDLIHRDIKPGNILLETGIRDRVKITDFGLARAADDASMTQSGVIAGTPMYMAPEQALGHKLDQRADLFSFGSVLYQMVSGRPPFRASSTLAVLKRLTEEAPRPIQEIIPETPRWLCDIISKLHAKNPDDRFQTANEVAELLDQHLAHLQNPSQVLRPAAVSLVPAAEKPMPAKQLSGPEMRPLMVPQGIRWPLLTATAIMFAITVLLLVVTESTGVTKLFSGSSFVQEPKPVFGEDSLPGKWVQLFNGKDLEGWVRNTDFPGNWRVEKGVLVGSGPDRIGMLQSAREDIGDFHLRAEVIINTEQADGGIFFRSLPQSSNELNLCFNPHEPTQQTGSLVIHKPNVKDSTWHSAPAGLAKANEWMTVEIIAQGNQAKTKINGQTAAISHSLCGNPRGQIMLQHLGPGTVIRFRKLEIKELKSDSELSTPLSPMFKNTLGMEFVLVPKGKSWLGGGKNKLGKKEVVIPADFYLGKYEVTQEEWEKVMGENPSNFSRTGGGQDAVKDVPEAELNRFPVEYVSWDQCQVFVAKLNQRENGTGWVYRLPTQAEWEYACRGGPMSDKADSAYDFDFAKPTNTLLPAQANVKHERGLARTCKVGLYEANRLGLFDMHGNVWEWCDDAGTQSSGDPGRALRGGSFGTDPSWSSSALAWRVYPPSKPYEHVGLRLARVPSGTPSPEAKAPPLAIAPFTDADAQRIAALPAAEQIAEVRKELMKRNPGFDGKFEHKIEGGVVTEFKVVTVNVSDIAPIRVFNALRVLDCRGTQDSTNLRKNRQLADLTPLHGMKLTGLTRLNLSSTRVGDAGLAHFQGCKNLTELKLAETQVTDAGLAHFKDCKSLQILALDRTQVGDAGLAHFQGCQHLTQIYLPATQVSNAGLGQIKDFKSLTHLHVGTTQVTDAGLAHFKDCKSLQFLALDRTQVSDAGLAHLKDCKNLSLLYLGNTQVSDVGLAHLKGMPLTGLWFEDTAITDLTSLQGMPLEVIRLTPKNITKGLDILRDMKSLKTIGITYHQAWPAAEFWERYDKGEFGTPPAPTVHDTWLKAAQLLPLDQHAAALPAKLKEKLPEFDSAFLRAIPRMSGDRQVIMAQAWLKERKPAFAGFDDAWLKAIPSMAADAQVILVTAWLKERNPAFDGVVTHKTEGGVLTSLEVPSPLMHDLTPLRVLTGLRSLTCLNPVGYDNRAESDAAVLRSLKKLESINGKSLAQFWKEIEARPAEFKEWLELVSALNANQKVAAVAAKFKERNPGFGGVVRQKVENGVVAELTFENVRDLSPLRALEGLTILSCTVGPLSDLSPLKGLPLTALNLRSTQVRDLSPLTGMQLTSLDLYSTQVRDLEPLKGQPLTLLILQFTKVQNLEPLKDMPLTRLHLNGCDQIRDLSPLKGMPLTWLELYGCRQVRDLGPLKGMPLTSLHLGSCPEVRDLEVLQGMPLKKLLINNTGVTDLKPLQALPLEYIRLTPKNITQGLDVLRDMKSLETIGVTDNQNLPAAEFWERYGKGEFQE